MVVGGPQEEGSSDQAPLSPGCSSAPARRSTRRPQPLAQAAWDLEAARRDSPNSLRRGSRVAAALPVVPHDPGPRREVSAQRRVCPCHRRDYPRHDEHGLGDLEPTVEEHRGDGVGEVEHGRRVTRPLAARHGRLRAADSSFWQHVHHPGHVRHVPHEAFLPVPTEQGLSGKHELEAKPRTPETFRKVHSATGGGGGPGGVCVLTNHCHWQSQPVATPQPKLKLQPLHAGRA